MAESVVQRETLPDGTAPSTRPKGRPPLRWYRYIALVILVVLSLAAAVAGTVVQQRTTATGPGPATAGAVDVPSTGFAAIPECRPEWTAGSAATWSTDRDASEAFYQREFPTELQQLPYVQGRDGWVFWGDVQQNNLSQAIGRRSLSPEELERWQRFFTTMRDELAAEGIPLIIAIAPAKWAIYREDLPEWAESISGITPLDQLLAASPDLPIVDLRPPLVEAKDEAQVFSKVNSHWTDFGALAGWAAIAGCLEAAYPELGPMAVPAYDEVVVTGRYDEYEDWDLPDTEPDWTTPVYREPLLDVVATSLPKAITETRPGTTMTGLFEMPVFTQVDGAANAGSALVLRDSFGSQLSVPLQQAFGSTYQVRHLIDYPADEQPTIESLLATTTPTVVIFQMAERHLNVVPVGSGLGLTD